MVTDWMKSYQKLRPKYKHFTSTMKELLTQLLAQEQIDYLTPVQARTKSILSFQEKVARKKYTNPLKQITDLTGLRIVVFYSDEIARIKEIIKDNFKVDLKNSVDKAAQLARNQFSYSSINYVVSLPKGKLEQSEYREYANMKFEIQVQTLCQYAWAEIQRKIEYKAEELVPSTLSRRLSRLVALFELVDDEFMAIRNEATQSLIQLPLGSLSVKHFLRTSPSLRNFVQKTTEAGFIRMKTQKDSKYLTELLQACSSLGFNKIASLDALLRSEANFASLMRSKKKHSRRIIRVGPIMLSLMLVYHSDSKFTRSVLMKNGWKEPALSILLDRHQESKSN